MVESWREWTSYWSIMRTHLHRILSKHQNRHNLGQQDLMFRAWAGIISRIIYRAVQQQTILHESVHFIIQKKKIRKESRYWCSTCKIPLCERVSCFGEYHSSAAVRMFNFYRYLIFPKLFVYYVCNICLC